MFFQLYNCTICGHEIPGAGSGTAEQHALHNSQAKHCTYSYLKKISPNLMGEYYCKPNLCIVIFVNIFDSKIENLVSYVGLIRSDMVQKYNISGP
jgi:hypothetical protein